MSAVPARSLRLLARSKSTVFATSPESMMPAPSLPRPNEPTRFTYRSRALRVLNETTTWLSSAEVATQSGLTYRQTIDAINALYNIALVSRQGRKFTARWGSPCLVAPDPATAAARRLEDYFRGGGIRR
jgi:hypothetical protein